jgi:hypothetical protein
LEENSDLNSVDFKKALNNLLNPINAIPSSHHFSTIDDDLNQSIGNVNDSDLGGLIIETRKCLELKFVIRNFF